MIFCLRVLTNYRIKALWNYKGMILDMGMKEDDLKRPSFYILTEGMNYIQVTLDNACNIAMVRDWLDSLNTEVPCVFVWAEISCPKTPEQLG